MTASSSWACILWSKSGQERRKVLLRDSLATQRHRKNTGSSGLPSWSCEGGNRSSRDDVQISGLQHIVEENPRNKRFPHRNSLNHRHKWMWGFCLLESIFTFFAQFKHPLFWDPRENIGISVQWDWLVFSVFLIVYFRSAFTCMLINLVVQYREICESAVSNLGFDFDYTLLRCWL